MKKFITPTYNFTPGASGVGSVNLSGVTGFNVKNLVSIINQTKGVVIYATGSQSLKYTNVTGTTVTLFADTSSMSAGDALQVIYEDNAAQPVQAVLVDKYGNEVDQLATYSGGTAIGNSVHRFSDNFVVAGPDLTVWDQSWTSQGSSFVTKGGEGNGSAFLKISMCPYTLNSEYVLTSKETFKFPAVLGFGYSASQRVIGTEFEFGIAGCDSNGNIEYIPAKPSVSLPATFTVTSNVATIIFPTNHPFKGLDRINVYGNTDNRLNVGPVVVTVVDNLTITFPIILANATYSCNGFIGFADPLGDVKNSAGLVIGDNTTVTQMQLYSRRNGASYRFANVTTNTSVATTLGSSNFTETFNSSNNIELIPSPDDFLAISRASDSIASPQIPVRFSQGVPDEEKQYKIYVRAKNSPRLPRPVAKIVSAVKTASTTATITTDVPHGLTTTSRITIYGIRDVANFPNLSSTTQVLAIVSPTVFTVTMGPTATATSAGGRVDSCDANTVITGGNFPNVFSISRTNNLLSINLNTTTSSVAQGETIHLYGCDATSMGLYDGAYLVRRIVGSTIIVDSVGPNFTAINCGGSILKRTDFRLHFVRLNDYLRTTVEVSSNGAGDSSKGIPVSGTVAVSSVSGTVQTYATGGYLDGFNTPPSVVPNGGYIDSISSSVNIFDSANNVIEGFGVGGNFSTGTNISGSFSPEFSGYAKFFVDISTFSGAGRIKVILQQQVYYGTFWRDVYAFEGMTSMNLYASPILPLLSTSYRLVVIVPTGVTCNLSIYYNKANHADSQLTSQKTYLTGDINLNSSGSLGDGLYTEDCNNFFLSANVVSQSSAATLAMEFSMNNIDWFTAPGTVATVAGVVVALKVENQSWNFARVKVVTGGTSVVFKEVILRGTK